MHAGGAVTRRQRGTECALEGKRRLQDGDLHDVPGGAMSTGALARFVSSEDGQDVVEYALLVALVVLVSLAGWNAILSAVTVSYDRADQGLWDLYWFEPHN